MTLLCFLPKGGKHIHLTLPDERINQMDYQEFINTLPINNLHKFDDPKGWLDIYSHHYPTEDQREEIYKLEDWISSYR